MITGLFLREEIISSFSRDARALVQPHPGHSIPVMKLRGHMYGMCSDILRKSEETERQTAKMITGSKSTQIFFFS